MKASLKKKAEGEFVREKAPRVVKAAAAKTLAKTTPTKAKKATPKVSKVEPAKASTTKAKKPKEDLAKTNPEIVMVPSAASLRLLEKVDIYRLWYQNNFSAYMANTAKVGGYAFIALGTLFASFSYILDKNFDQLTAAVVCIEENCSTVDDKDLPPGAPLVTFINSLPTELHSDTDIILKMENSSEFRVFLQSKFSGAIIDLTPSEVLGEGQFRYLIPAKTLSPSTYTMVAEAKTASATYKFTGPSFSIPNIALLEKVEPKVVLAELSTTTDNATEDPDNIIDEVATTTEIEVVEEIESLDAEETSANVISLDFESQNEAKFLKVQTGNLLPQSVEVYAKLEFAPEALFLGLATLVQGEWVFSLSALDLPNLDLILYSSFVVDDVEYKSEGILYTPNSAGVSDEQADDAILEQKITLALTSSSLDINTRNNYFERQSSSSEILFDPILEEQYASQAILSVTDTKMSEVEDSINILLARYGSVVQGGRKYLIDLADAALISHYRSLSSAIALEVGEKAITPTLETVLALRYQTLKDRVSNFEAELATITSSLTAKDSDSDGISDFDELSIYKTNPQSADTDIDSVLDGVEIVRNFDPLFVDVSKFAHLGQVSDEMEQDEVVKITSVKPIIIKGITNQEEEVFALIEGSTIPNTFVTIMSYSSSTIGMIKANATGDFTYTLEKSFGEGQQEIVAALTDNTGDIVASSKPYHFIKTKNAFVAAALGNKQATFEENGEEDSILTSTIIAAIAVVTFGFILLLLGQNIRNKKTLATAKQV